MKIAICMSGLTRTFGQCYKSLLENLIGGRDSDIFAVVSDDDNNIDLNLVPITRKLVLKKEDMPVFEEDKYRRGWRMQRATKRYTVATLIEQYWKMEKCFKLVENYSNETGVKYDWVIRCRPDLRYFEKITPPIEELDNNFMYIPPHKYMNKWQVLTWTDEYFKSDYVYDYDSKIIVGLPDQFAISNMENMKNYVSKYSDLDNFHRDGGSLHAEKNVSYILRKCGVKVKFIRPFFEILRPEGYHQYMTEYPKCK